MNTLHTNKSKWKESSGFSLIELTVSMALFAILTAGIISFINPSSQIKKSHDGRRKADLESIRSALEQYMSDYRDYPGSTSWCAQLSHASFPEIRQALELGYISKVPSDPSYAGTDKDYYYWHNASGQYRLYTVLENTSDPLVDANALGDDGGIGTCTGANANYNYRLRNP